MAAPKSFRARFVARRKKISKWARSTTVKRFVHRTVPILIIFGVCGFISYGHGVTFALMSGESAQNARLMPVLYDALMFVSVLFMAPTVRHPVAKFAAWAGFVYGFVMSLIGNIVASAPTVAGKVVGVSVAVALVITAALVHFGTKAKPKRKAAETPTVARVRSHRPVPAQTVSEAPRELPWAGDRGLVGIAYQQQ